MSKRRSSFDDEDLDNMLVDLDNKYFILTNNLLYIENNSPIVIDPEPESEIASEDGEHFLEFNESMINVYSISSNFKANRVLYATIDMPHEKPLICKMYFNLIYYYVNKCLIVIDVEDGQSFEISVPERAKDFHVHQGIVCMVYMKYVLIIYPGGNKFIHHFNDSIHHSSLRNGILYVQDNFYEYEIKISSLKILRSPIESQTSILARTKFGPITMKLEELYFPSGNKINKNLYISSTHESFFDDKVIINDKETKLMCGIITNDRHQLPSLFTLLIFDLESETLITQFRIRYTYYTLKFGFISNRLIKPIKVNNIVVRNSSIIGEIIPKKF
jgi:hypothetical protein